MKLNTSYGRNKKVIFWRIVQYIKSWIPRRKILLIVQFSICTKFDMDVYVNTVYDDLLLCILMYRHIFKNYVCKYT
jgi:hypothetical protein